METNEKKAYKLIAKRNGIDNSQIKNGNNLHDLVKSMGGLVGQLPPDAKSALEDVTLLEVAVRERKKQGLAPILFKAERARDIFALKAKDKKFSPLTYKRGYYIDKASPIKVAKAKDGTYVLTDQKGEVLAMANDVKTAQRQRVALSKASVLAPGKTIESKHAVPVAKSVESIHGKNWDTRMAAARKGRDQDLDKLVRDKDWAVRNMVAGHGRDQDLDILVNDKDPHVLETVIDQGRDKDLDKLAYGPISKVGQGPLLVVNGKALDEVRRRDLENLKKIQKEGKITQTNLKAAGCKDLDDLATKLSDWRKSSKADDRMMVAMYGRDYDLDKLRGDENWIVRKSVADRGRDQDLDKLARDPDEYVRAEVALQGRDQDLDTLVNDPDEEVRAAVASRGRDQDLDKLANDPVKDVRKIVARVNRQKDLENLKKMQKEGKISKDLNISKLADKLPQWRESSEPEDKRKLAKYGRDRDLDKLVKDKYPSVRAAVAKRGREQDLDKLRSDKNWKVRNLVNTEKTAEKEDEGPEL